MNNERSDSRMDLVSSLVVGLFGAFTLALGIWAIVDTTSFYENIAEFPPYNRHFLHDLGAFQIGLGAALLLALVWREMRSRRCWEARRRERRRTGWRTSATSTWAGGRATRGRWA